jgi:type VI secretion system protein ImpC
MTAKLNAASFEMGIKSEPRTRSSNQDARDRFNIILLGDFAGRANRGLTEPVHMRNPVRLDVDNFEAVLGRIGAKLNLPDPTTTAAAMELAFASLDDFHPDRLLHQAKSLTSLAEARRLLLSPGTAERGKEALQAILGKSGPPPSPAASEEKAPAAESDDDTMARLLGGAVPATGKPPAPSSRVEQFIQQVITPHVTPGSASWQPVALAAAEMELAHRLRAILHQPDFQSLEANWRGADLLVRRVESSEDISLSLLDVCEAELRFDLASAQTVQQSALFRLLRDRQPSLLVGYFTFGASATDLHLLGKLAGLATALGSPLLATGSPGLVGCDAFAEHPDSDDWKFDLPADATQAWQSLRKSAEAHYVGLASPRFLQRQPYGKTGDAIETFPFEELPGQPAHDTFLWGCPAVLCACTLIDALQAGETELSSFSGGEIGELPVHKYRDGEEVVVKSYAEAWFTDRAVERMLARGITPLIPVKNQNTIRINSLRSIAADSSNLRFR